MTKIKICGLKSEEDIRAVNRLRPDFVGFVFARTDRYVSEERAAEMRAALDPDIPAVGVFVQASVEQVARLCAAGTIQYIQLHGEEDEAYIRRVRQAAPGVSVIRAVRVKSREDILEAEKLDCDYLLLDTYVEGVAGGTGQEFDRSLIPELSKPYFLAGGLSAENVRENIALCHPFAVDVSSAVETDGCKDEDKIEEFIERVRCDE